jgi:hypothetical protein
MQPVAEGGRGACNAPDQGSRVVERTGAKVGDGGG